MHHGSSSAKCITTCDLHDFPISSLHHRHSRGREMAMFWLLDVFVRDVAQLIGSWTLGRWVAQGAFYCFARFCSRRRRAADSDKAQA